MSQDFSDDSSDFGSDFDWGLIDAIVDKEMSPKKPAAPSTPPSKQRVTAGASGSPSITDSTKITRTLGKFSLTDDGDEDESEYYDLPRRLLFNPPKDGSSEATERGFRRIRTSSSMDPPPVPPPRPLEPSSTQTSLESVNSLFSVASASSSMSSLATSAPSSPRKRSLGTKDSEMSPCKNRKLGPTESAPPRPTSVITPSSVINERSSGFPLQELFGGTHGSALPHYIIAHSAEVQSQFDKQGILLGVQWELARGVSKAQWTWKDVLDKMGADKMGNFPFKASHSMVAGKVAAKMLGRPESESNDLALWNEVDREHEAFIKGESRGLGLMGLEGYPHYYGGQIQYPLHLEKADSDDAEDTYRIALDKPRRGRSNRFARDLGSPSVLQLSIPENIVRHEGEDVRRFLARRFIINGRVYVAIPPKDKGSVYLIQTNQNWQRTPSKFFGDQHRLSFEEFVQRHNPPQLNFKQPFAKYTARFALGLSTSLPVLEFQKENIFRIEDVWAQDWMSRGKPPSEKIMTDGCGFINRAAMLVITKHVPYASLPTAVQARIGGAKGLWTLHPIDTNPNNPPRIWIRDSQQKINFEHAERVHRILDLLRASHPAQAESTVTLSEQSIMCLSYNGVPDKVFEELMIEGLKSAVQPLLNWDEAVELWRAVNTLGSVSSSRKQRIAGGKSRVLGYVDREREEHIFEDGDEIMDGDFSRTGRDVGGGPLSLHEQAVELIQAGFRPGTCAYLNEKMKYIIKLEIKSVVEKYKISLPEGTAVSDAFVIPDPLGILKENEIYYRSSSPMKNIETQTLFNILKGPIIIGRYPIRLPCDMQKVMAVDVPDLYDWPDVVIVSTAGTRSLLSLLSGGDYDGDTVFFTWFQPFLQHFQNQPFTDPPDDLMSTYFQQDVQTVDEVGRDLQNISSTAERQAVFQDCLLAGLQESQVGQYSWFHGIAIWRHGYNHMQSILMAYIGNTLLDAAKTGLSLQPGVFEAHMKEFGRNYPKAENNWCPPATRRDDPSKPYILEILSRAGETAGGLLLRAHDFASGKLQENSRQMTPDPVLLQPFKHQKQKALTSFPDSESELRKIETHVEAVWTLYKSFLRESKDKSGDKGKPGDKGKRAAALAVLQRKYTAPTADLLGLFDEHKIEELKASYAYSLKEDFAFAVAFRVLCEIKSRAAPGGMAPTSRLFDELKSISSSASRALQNVEDY